MRIQGIIPALVSPFAADGSIGVGVTTRLVRALNTQGADGYFVTGSSGECYLLSSAERMQLFETVAAAADERTVIAHVGSADHRETLRLTRDAEGAGADAVAAGIPTYFDYTGASLTAYYRQLREQTGLPLLAYYIPARTGRVLPAEFFLELAADGTLQGIKYTSTDLAMLSRLHLEGPEDFTVLAGAEEVLPGALALGADGGIGASFTMVGALFAELYAAHRAGRAADVSRLHAKAAPLLRLMAQGELAGFLKSALRTRGMDVGQARAPFAAVTPEQDWRLACRLEGMTDLAPYLLPES